LGKVSWTLRKESWILRNILQEVYNPLTFSLFLQRTTSIPLMYHVANNSQVCMYTLLAQAFIRILFGTQL
jgi:hypothetical protein